MTLVYQAEFYPGGVCVCMCDVCLCECVCMRACVLEQPKGAMDNILSTKGAHCV